jgi:pimeloyl-ACP methyl ester carboxylesterase
MLMRLARLFRALVPRLGLGGRRALSVPPVSLVYYTAGPRDGEPWVFLHGMGSMGVSWRPVVKALRRSCRILVPELSALGGTAAPEGGLGIRQGAAVIARLIEDEWGGRPVTVAGLSLGGWMAVRLALARPDLVSRLVLIDAGGYRNQNWDRIQELVTISDLAGVDRLYRALFVRTPWLLRVSRGAFLESYTSPGVKKILTGTAEADTFDDRELARLSAPTALIWGEGDGLFSLEGARAMAAAIPASTLTVIAGCGHAPHLECPDRLIEALQTFRRTTPAGGSPPPVPAEAPAAAMSGAAHLPSGVK